MPLGRLREKLLSQALQAMAKNCGIALKEPLHIDGNGEFSVVDKPADAGAIPGQAGHYGEAFAAWLSTVPHRTGTHAVNARVLPENGWCGINHFEVENLVRAYADAQRMTHQEGDESSAGRSPAPRPKA